MIAGPHSPPMSTHSLPARLLLRRHSPSSSASATAVEQLHARVEAERRAAGAAAIRAQEQERQRLAQDLHDEVNQALTAILLRLEATIQEAPPALQDELRDTKRLAAQAMEELLRLARRLRPAVLDDHGLMPALHTQVRDFTEQTGIRATFHPQRRADATLTASSSSRSTASRRRGSRTSPSTRRRSACSVELSFVGRTVLRISDDGHGFARRASDRLGLERDARACAAGRRTLSVWSTEGSGTRVELTI